MFHQTPSAAPEALHPAVSLTRSSRRDLFETSDVRPRRPRRTRFYCNYWENWSTRLGRPVGLYRDINYDDWIRIECDPEIVWYNERPTPVRLRLRDRAITCQFDVVFERRDGTFVCRRLRYGKVSQEQLEAESRWCRQFGFRYDVIDEAALLEHKWLIVNWKRMLPYLPRTNQWIERQILTNLAEDGWATLGAIERLVFQTDLQVVRASMFALLHRGMLVAPSLVHGPLTVDTVMRRASV